MKPRSLTAILFILGAALLSLAAVTKKPDPILDTQADAVSVEEEQKEEAEGRKGPASPTLDFFPKRGFLTELPVVSPKATPAEPAKEDETDLGLWLEESEEKGTGEVKPGAESDDTWEDVSATDGKSQEGGLS